MNVCTRVGVVYVHVCMHTPVHCSSRGRSWVSKSVTLHFIPFEPLVGLEARLVASKP